MMQFDPSLVVNRLLVFRQQENVYDEPFHKGVNILRGDNSSGKSTILNFLFYGLGGDLSDWSDVALLCTHVVIEASFNGRVATLRREISTDAARSMDIYGGNYETALKAPIAEWSRYPYRRSNNIESFSQVLFRLLGMPEAVSDETGNLTMHQILRLLYADQLSPVEQIFKFEPFDPPILRDSIGRLLCGAYEAEVYNNELRIRELTKRFDQASADLRSLISILGRTDQAHTVEWIEGQRRVLEDRRTKIQLETETAEQRLFASGAEDEITLQAQNTAYIKVRELQSALSKLREERDDLQLTISDSGLFIEHLQRSIEALSDSRSVAESLGDIRFRSCPVCYAGVESDVDEHKCHLCKTPFSSGPAHNRIVALINEYGRQLKQSNILQSRRINAVTALEEKCVKTEQAWLQASRQLNELQRLPSSELSSRLRSLARDAGYLDREIEDLDRKVGIAAEISRLSEIKQSLNAEIVRLRTRNEVIKASQGRRLSYAHALIGSQILSLLHGDLPRQDAFVDAKFAKFDFGANSIGVDQATYFSASSRVILKTSFFVGFLLAATKDKEFRHPRFCMIDTIEDKGMEQVRSHNYQRMIVASSKQALTEHQIIFATAMIAPELETEEYIVGARSNLAQGSLKIARSSSASLI